MNGPDVAAFYGRYPYPKVDQVEYDRNLHDHARYLAHACAQNPAPRRGNRRGRMLIAGCGTREAALWGSSLPHFDIDAVDLSDASLGISEALLAQLELTNVRLRRGDFERGEGIEGPYDFIGSFGVLHHLESPAQGLAALEAALAPGGTMALMVYSHSNRRSVQAAQRVIGLLSGDASGAELERIGLELCQHGAKVSGRLQRVFDEGLRDHTEHRQHFADTLLNPREVSYSIPELVALLDTAGLEIVAPMQPMDWELEGALAPDKAAVARELPLLERLELADLLMGPLFWVLARRKAERTPPRPCLTDAALFWALVPMPLDTGAWAVRELVVQKPPKRIRAQARPLPGDRVGLSRNARHERVYHEIAGRMLRYVDGRRTLDEIARRAAAEVGTDFKLVEATLRTFLHRMMDDQGLMTPDVTRCAGCSLR